MISIREHLQIDPNASLPIVAQIQQQITWLIASGNLKAGDRLPPIRELAGQLGVHMHTIRFAYQRLESEGLVSTRLRIHHAHSGFVVGSLLHTIKR